MSNKTVVNTDKVEIDENDRSKGILTLPNGKKLNIYLFLLLFLFFEKKGNQIEVRVVSRNGGNKGNLFYTSEGM